MPARLLLLAERDATAERGDAVLPKTSVIRRAEEIVDVGGELEDGGAAAKDVEASVGVAAVEAHPE